MCDPITLGLAALGGAATLFGSGGNEAAPPPPPPVLQPTKAKEPDAEVRVGDGAKKAKASATPAYDGFSEKRVVGKSLGGLGRGGLGL